MHSAALFFRTIAGLAPAVRPSGCSAMLREPLFSRAFHASSQRCVVQKVKRYVSHLYCVCSLRKSAGSSRRMGMIATWMGWLLLKRFRTSFCVASASASHLLLLLHYTEVLSLNSVSLLLSHSVLVLITISPGDVRSVLCFICFVPSCFIDSSVSVKHL